jgi:ABC-type lipoprotein export system ATPase subunit
VTETRLTLISAVATKVLGEYTHKITFSEEEDFLIVFGPNGVGKTRFLEIIHAVSRLDGSSLQQLPFESAILRYSNGTEITVNGGAQGIVAPSGKSLFRRIQFALRTPGKGTPVRWDFKEDALEQWLESNTSWRATTDAGMWEDRNDGELAHIIELKDRFSELTRRFRDGGTDNPMPAAFARYREHTKTYLIETQRLRIEAVPRKRSVSARGPRERVESKIVQHATKMQNLLISAQTEHSTITQQRDRDFPFRVLSGTTALPQASEVRMRYEEQNAFRSRLGRVASVDLSDELELPDRELDDWELRLLNLYLDDAQAKLAPFEKLLQKIELLEEIVNSRLLRKRLEITARDGLAVRHAPDDRPISLDSLSSGEQHEIILMFDLLFNVPAGALVMIDEPEISLHVVWQLAFIPDVQKIAELADFRFVVATHSPQIINDSWDRAIPLGPEEEPFA